MTPRERILRTFRFEQTDQVACDLMEGQIWPQLQEDFRHNHNCESFEQTIEYLNPDCRWLSMNYAGPQIDGGVERANTYSWKVSHGPLAGATTIAEVEASPEFDPAWWQAPDCAAARQRWPDHALVLFPGWMPLFWGACQAFGMEDGLTLLYTEPHVFEAYVQRRHERYMELLSVAAARARGICDLCWLGDDYASQQAMIMGPEMWRKFIKPYLTEQVRLLREHDLLVLFHSCGAVRSILPDLIDIGINGHLVFQTSAVGMNASSIARDFGGSLVFYGGIDVQQVLSFGTPDDVQAAVIENCRAFEHCGGYIVANSHHGLDSVRGMAIETMFTAGRSGSGYSPGRIVHR